VWFAFAKCTQKVAILTYSGPIAETALHEALMIRVLRHHKEMEHLSEAPCLSVTSNDR